MDYCRRFNSAPSHHFIINHLHKHCNQSVAKLDWLGCFGDGSSSFSSLFSSLNCGRVSWGLEGGRARFPHGRALVPTPFGSLAAWDPAWSGSQRGLLLPAPAALALLSRCCAACAAWVPMAGLPRCNERGRLRFSPVQVRTRMLTAGAVALIAQSSVGRLSSMLIAHAPLPPSGGCPALVPKGAVGGGDQGGSLFSK
jgi:hypothetical protein